MKQFNPKELDLDWYGEEGFGDIWGIAPQINPKLIINAAITGIVPTKKNTPHVPITPQEIIVDALKCVQAGASVLHLHARDSAGRPTYKADVFKEIIWGIRSKAPEVIICATTSGRVDNYFECRSEVLRLTGDYKPDMASLTLGSMNFPQTESVTTPEMIQQLALLMLEKGIKPELEVFETGMLNYALYLHRKGFLQSKMYFNLLLGSLGTMPARIIDLDHLLTLLPPECTWAGAGIGRFQLPINILSILKGGQVRVGLEDNIYYDCHKQELATNEQLIQRLVKFAQSRGREVATPTEARMIIGV
jgi:uncharacterized protein (DUF849 family)